MERRNPNEVAELLIQALTSNLCNLEELEIHPDPTDVSIYPAQGTILLNADAIFSFARANKCFAYITTERQGNEFYRPVIRIII